MYNTAFRSKDVVALGIFLFLIVLLRHQYGLVMRQILNSSTQMQKRFNSQGMYLLPYYNFKNADEGYLRRGVAKGRPIAFSDSNYPKGGPAIAALTTNLHNDVGRLVYAMKQLHNLKGDDEDYPAPVLVFHEGNLSAEQREALVRATDRPVAFPVVNFQAFPAEFDKEWETESISVKDRPPWGYLQMNRFWLTGVWRDPALQPFGTLMRMDSDSCFMEETTDLPRLYAPTAAYHSQYIGYAKKGSVIEGLYDFTVKWMDRVGKKPGNPMMWQFVVTTWEEKKTLPIFRTNLEVFKIGHMKRKDVTKYVEALTEKEPFGVMRQGWDYAAIRFIMAAVFMTNDLVIMHRPKGYAHGEFCDPINYEMRFGRAPK